MEAKSLEKVRALTRGSVLFSEPLANHASYRVGGKAEALVVPRSIDESARLYRFARRHGIPLAIIGNGTNLIPPDMGLAGIVLKMSGPAAAPRSLGGYRARVSSSMRLNDLATWAAKRGLSGLEPLAGIPGSVGGAVVMNAGAKEAEIARFVRSVEVLSPSGKRRTFAGVELSFAYRHSVFLGEDWLVLSVEFALSRGNPKDSLRQIEARILERERKYPPEPNAGSVFRRPQGDYAGRLIEASGCKGLRVGGARVSDLHANFIVNAGGATAADIIALIAKVRKAVFDASGVYLELEQIVL
ncbi:MAG: UDP-N-acetylmuramate dehydrogenase [Candidatus Latescibacterota bacterium]|jgi:UDP-N-acetylmuramate dehydrogenase|nr:MAG: UDP-N-acetylmuramate dehydrogenase [Candidatus Latescibacterota bacterium]